MSKQRTNSPGRLGQSVIGQTSFNDSHLLAVSQRFLQPLLRSRLANRAQGAKPLLSIWSVGCGNGAEIYSLLLQVAKLTKLSAWNLHLLATDLSRSNLARAQAALYSSPQLANIAPEDLSRFFTPVQQSDSQDHAWHLTDQLKSLVDFRMHNILAPKLPTDRTESFNLILCRQLLQHLNPGQRRTILGKLAKALSRDGLLIVAPGQASSLDHPLLQVLPEELDSVLTRTPATAQQNAPQQPLPQPQQNTPTLRNRLRRTFLPASAASTVRKKNHTSTHRQPSAAELLRRARQLAQDFQLPQALLACRRATQLDQFSVEAHYLSGVLARRMDRLDEALEALKRACYLDKSLIMAHFLLGHIYQQTNKPSLAKHHYQATLQALEQQPDNQPVPLAEGLSFQMLKDLSHAGIDALAQIPVGEKS